MRSAIPRVVGIAFASLLVSSLSHANAPSGRYAVSNSTVQDKKTGLVWAQGGNSATYTWSGAKGYCSGLGSGWRLPTAKELLSIWDIVQVDLAGAVTAIDNSVFLQTQADDYWSSTSFAGGGKAWCLNFSAQRSGLHPDDVTATHFVRCVK